MNGGTELTSPIVVGAGISGLVAARTLREHIPRVVVLESEPKVGGRMATRNIQDGSFDYGAQFFTVRGERFGRMVEEWQAGGVVEEWSRGFADATGRESRDGHPRYRGVYGMISIPRYLCRGLDVRVGERVVEANARGGVWELRTERGNRVTGGALILTPPAPSSLALVRAGDYELPDSALSALENISYSPCITVMALLEGSSALPEPGGVQVKGEPVDWMADNYRKGISEAPAITIHAGPGWSRQHWEDGDGEIARSLLDAVGGWIGAGVKSFQVARWHYSWVERSHPEPCLYVAGPPPVIFAGDAFGGAKVEGAALSGLAAAEQLLDGGGSSR